MEREFRTAQQCILEARSTKFEVVYRDRRFQTAYWKAQSSGCIERPCRIVGNPTPAVLLTIAALACLVPARHVAKARSHPRLAVRITVSARKNHESWHLDGSNSPQKCDIV
jgi:hypothetical protein